MLYNTNTDKVYKLALGVEYDGTNYHGWQKQNEITSVQQKLEEAIAEIACHPITLHCAGRTDAGVHSIGQVAHFYTSAKRTLKSWILGTNSKLPKDISVNWMKHVPHCFHARFSAISRRYIYLICNKNTKPAILYRNAAYYHVKLDNKKMHDAGQHLIGEKDFVSFRSRGCQSQSTIRNIMHLSVIRLDNYVIVDIKANSFMQHMVRKIVGNLIEIGNGNKNINWLTELLSAKDSKKNLYIAKPNGLYLTQVEYPSYYNLPMQTYCHFMLR